MKRVLRFTFAIGVLVLEGQPARAPEALSAWPYFKEVRGVNAANTGYFEIVLDRETLDKVRTDEADLRLYDNARREIPYALRVRRGVDTNDENSGREFNHVVKDGATQISLDLGEQSNEHNQVGIESVGNNFRRYANVEGSADGAQWSTLVSKGILFRFTADSQTVEQQWISYPVSRFRFIRVTISRDPLADQDAPGVNRVRVRRLVRMQGEYTQTAAVIEPREAGRSQGRPASIWRFDLGGRIPFQEITLAPADGDYSRPFLLEAVDDPSAPVLIASGELTHTQKPGRNKPAIQFEERFARRLRLTIIDDRNEPLQIGNVTAFGAARQLVFEGAAGLGANPLRLFYGNPQAPAPHYDLDTKIPSNATVMLTRLPLGSEQRNPVYRPEPKPFSEREPWVVYVVLAGACAVLAWLLMSVARAARVETGSPSLPEAN